MQQRKRADAPSLQHKTQTKQQPNYCFSSLQPPGTTHSQQVLGLQLGHLVYLHEIPCLTALAARPPAFWVGCVLGYSVLTTVTPLVSLLTLVMLVLVLVISLLLVVRFLAVVGPLGAIVDVSHD